MIDKDRIIRSTGKVAELRFVIVDATESVNKIVQKHGATFQALKILGETCVSSLLLASGLKYNGVVKVSFHYSGDLSVVTADATPMGLVRGHVSQDELKKVKDFEMILSPQKMVVRKINEQGKKVQESIVEMNSIYSGPNLAHYQLVSEQIKSAVGVFSKVSQDGTQFDYCAGFLIETFPKVDEYTILSMEENIKKISSFDKYYSKNRLNIYELLDTISGEFEYEIHKEIPVNFYCPCSIKSVEKTLLTLGSNELKKMLSETPLEIFCEFCRKRYEFDENNVKKLMESL